MPDSRNSIPDIEIKIFYFFRILSLTMFTFDRAKATKRRSDGLKVGRFDGETGNVKCKKCFIST
jgi:hypothetical protein